ncbi:MAG TPA: hypothetical protein VGB34_05975 [Candidatus Limnocylindria bacterium]
MNWRAAGCILTAIGIFLAITLFGMSLAFSGARGCPPSLQWGDRIYEPVGSAAEQPTFGESGEPVALGSTFIGLTTRTVFGPHGSHPSAAAGDRPDQIALDCDDGSFQTYAVGRTLVPTSVDPSPSPP